MVSIDGYNNIFQIYQSVNTRIFRGIRQVDGLPVILKLLKSDYPSVEETAYFKREYEITRDLDLEGVIKLYGLERYHNSWLLAQEDIGGESLDLFLKKHKLSVVDSLQLVMAITEALGEVHQENVVHKDINPSNIILNSALEAGIGDSKVPSTGSESLKGQIKLIDFGIATKLTKETADLVAVNVLDGTLQYMSPEQTGRMNCRLDYRTDLYSLGVTFYELLVGKTPFEVDDTSELVHCHIAKEPISPSEIDSDVPHAISEIVLKLMAKAPEDRYQSAPGLLSDLQYCLDCLREGKDLASFEVGRSDVSSHFHIPSKLYGRDDELAALLNSFSKASAGQCVLMLVAGYSGVGKSSLVREIHRPVIAKKGYFFTGKYDQFSRNVPYAGLIQAFQDLIKQLLSETPDQLVLWREKILEAVAPNTQLMIEVIPELEMIVGAQRDVPELDVSAAHNRFKFTLLRFIQVFAQKGHPIVLFLDDLQWADSNSVDLLGAVLVSPVSKYLLLIGGYRDNEVDASHPLLVMRQELIKGGGNVKTLSLSPLTEESVSQLLADTLRCPKSRVESLGKLIIQKTGGNPFFIREFTKLLYLEKSLRFDRGDGAWTWDTISIENQAYTDNVLELMVGNILNLPRETQQIISVAAVIGNKFGLRFLSKVCNKSLGQVATALWPAVEAELIEPCDTGHQQLLKGGLSDRGQSTPYDVEFIDTFVHDRIQQAALGLIDHQALRQHHLIIGRLLLSHYEETRTDGAIFEIVRHLNECRSLLQATGEKDNLASLNFKAGQKATEATAYESAYEYLKIAKALLSESTWESNYRQMYDVCQNYAECAYLNNDYELALQVIDDSFDYARNNVDKTKLLRLQSLVYTQQGLTREAANSILAALRIFGIPLYETTKENRRALESESQAYTSSIDLDVIRGLDCLPVVEKYNLEKKTIIDLMVFAYLPLIQIQRMDIANLLSYRALRLSESVGITDSSPSAFVHFAAYLSKKKNYCRIAFELGETAISVNKRLNAGRFKSKLLFMHAVQLYHFGSPVRGSVDLFQKAYACGVETGDLVEAGFCTANTTITAMLAGYAMPELKKIYSNQRALADEVYYTHRDTLFPFYRQVMLALEGKTSSLSDLNDEQFSEHEYWRKLPDKSDVTLIWIMPIKVMLLVFEGKFAEALNCSEDAEPVFVNLPNIYCSISFLFYYTLALIAVNSTRPEQRRSKKITDNCAKIQGYMDACPQNFEHQYYLLKAELACGNGEKWDAVEYYEKAIVSARENNFLHISAFANERLAIFWLEHDKENLSRVYFTEALYMYELWGAKAKVTELKEKYPDLIRPLSRNNREPESQLSSVSENDPSNLDLGRKMDLSTVIKASNVISGEMLLPQLLKSLLKLILENSGAQKAILILNNKGQLSIEATGDVNQIETVVLESTRLDSNKAEIQDYLPLSIIRYVERTLKPLVLEETANQANQFSQDPYFKKATPRSILCVPVIHHNKLAGLLVLENNLTAGVFTLERVDLLNVLLSQAATSIENATLYDELKVANDDLRQSLKVKQHFLSAISHELRTPMNTIMGGLQFARSHSDEGIESSLAIVQNGASEMMSLVNDVLTHTEIQSGALKVNSHNVSVSVLFEKLFTRYQAQCEQKQLQLHWNRDETVPEWLLVDELKLEIILSKLLDNAIKFTERGFVSLSIGWDQTSGLLQCAIEDSGIGIGREDLSKIFDEFTQSEGGFQRRFGGLGIGLSICNNLTEALGGSISQISKVGRGSCFTVSIPLQTGSLPDKEQAQYLASAELPILIVEDNVVNQKMMTKMLKRLGYTSIVANHGQEALEILGEEQSSLILMDLQMPVMDGFTCAEVIRGGVASFRDIPIIAVSANLMDTDKAHCVESGMNDFLEKPVRLDSLRGSLSEYIEPV